MDVKQVMTADPSGAGLVEFANITGEQLVRDQLTRSQIRNVFTEVRKIEALWESKRDDARRRLNMLKPKLAYQTNRTPQIKNLSKILTQAIDEVEKAPDETERDHRFRRLIDLYEAILAYHRASGAKN